MSDTWADENTGELLMEFVDTDGSHGKVKVELQTPTLAFSDPGPTALIPDAAALSNALLEKAFLLRRAVNTTPAINGSGPYDLVKDKLRFVWNGEEGERVTWELPAPVETCLQSDQLYVDLTNTDVANLIAYVKANCLSAEGDAITDVALAFRTRPGHVKNQL
jgi:hypothetical protein